MVGLSLDQDKKMSVGLSIFSCPLLSFEPQHVIFNKVAFDKCILRRGCASSFKLRNFKLCSVGSLTVMKYSSD